MTFQFARKLFRKLPVTVRISRHYVHNWKNTIIRDTAALTKRDVATQAASQSLDAPQGESSVNEQGSNPLEHHDYFGVRDLVTVEDLFNARVHMGHKEGSRNIYMTPYIFGTRMGMDIIDLDQTITLLGDALNFTAHIAYREGIVLFLSRHYQTLLDVEKTAVSCGEYSHCREWKGGTFTNSTIQYGLVTRLPDLSIFISTHNTIFEQHIGIVEMAKMNIPTVGIVDSSCDPRLITYPVPGNDDSPSAVKLYCELFKKAILKGKTKAKEEFGEQSQ